MTYIDFHTSGVKGLSEKQFKDAVKRIEPEFRARGVKPSEVLYNLSEGRSFCITEASSSALIKEAHLRAGLPVDDILPVDKISGAF
ncbi:MAG: DUF4242 domain-containing protein [Thaumarchaeota archaeon]|nr:DUF4242 domain-containing protein [Nitrososphaerota archaeon]MCL5316873.1 DUF4242 domain-containing protein [Nitrososphaerota archaeon]